MIQIKYLHELKNMIYAIAEGVLRFKHVYYCTISGVKTVVIKG